MIRVLCQFMRALMRALVWGVVWGVVYVSVLMLVVVGVIGGTIRLVDLMGLSSNTGLLLGFGVLFASVVLGLRWFLRFEKAKRTRHMKPVLDAIQSGPIMTGPEKQYHEELLRHLGAELPVAPKPESPLTTGTRVDAFMSFDDADWYLTVKRPSKRGFGNQQRLVLQGEIEDILATARHDRRIRILALVGTPIKFGDDEKPFISENDTAQLMTLMAYAQRRVGEFCSSSHYTGNERTARELIIEVVPVPVLT